jgi:UDP-GlcNAc:undecaprenyl-phosphate/decaprenyl-phosphate GlcNAc-1-phosphate transferase
VHGTWLAAFAVALVIAVVATPLLRRVALAAGFVDLPGPTKSHSGPMPYLGGVAIAGATLVGWVLESGLSTRMAVVAMVAVAVCLVGLVDDQRKLDPWVRLAAEGGAAAVVASAGVRADVTSIAVVDIVLTILWIVGVTNAFNLLDNVDGLAAGTGAAAATGVFALAAIEDQRALAAVAIALSGACLGFLVHNWRPASIFMGDAGALFIGFVLSVAVLEVEPVLPRPESLAVPGLLLAMPVLDTTLVSIARIRRGRSLITGGKDHLSHRLVRLGLPTSVAVAVLVAVEAVVAALAVLCGSGVLSVWPATAIGVVMLATLAIVTTRADVYAETPAIVRARPWQEPVSTRRPGERHLVSVAHDANDTS